GAARMTRFLLPLVGEGYEDLGLRSRPWSKLDEGPCLPTHIAPPRHPDESRDRVSQAPRRWRGRRDAENLPFPPFLVTLNLFQGPFRRRRGSACQCADRAPFREEGRASVTAADLDHHDDKSMPLFFPDIVDLLVRR